MLTHVGPEIVEMARCDAQQIGDVETNEPERALQEIPPAVRRLVLRRDHGQCQAPGCRNASFLDLHHIQLRSEGANHDPDRLLVLCGAHHRAAHRGTLLIEGAVSTGVVFRHADGTRYGCAVSPELAEAHTLAFEGLRSLGFR